MDSKMDFKDFVCEKLKNAGDIRAKGMFGSYNICLDNVNLGVICVDKWYLKKTFAGDDYLQKHNINLEVGIKANSYIVRDFSDSELLCELARITCEALKKK